jgi:MazG family protein
MAKQELTGLLTEFNEFVEIVRILREKCPWDREQTHESLRRCMLEESYEVLDAIDSGNKTELKKELGDVFLQVVFHSIMGEETGDFNLVDVMREEREKLIERHPHVFGDTKVSGTDEVLVNWEKLKKKEGRESVLDGIPSELPALFKAYRIQEKAVKVGFDWKDKEPVFDKIREEVEELRQNVESGADQKEIEEELGDVLFSIVNYARFIKVNPEDALRQTVSKFSKRFRKIEEYAKAGNKELEEMSLEEMDEIWNKAKEENL